MSSGAVVRFLWICAGGALGTGMRYLLSGWTARALGPAFPYGTLAVNLAGSFAIGLVMRIGLDTALLAPDLRVVLVTGLLGGFTTYSAFSYETLGFFEVGAWHVGTSYVLATVLGCLAACAFGGACGRWITGA